MNKGDGSVFAFHGLFQLTWKGKGGQIQNGLLNLRQQGRAFAGRDKIPEKVDFPELFAIAVRLVVSVQKADVVPTLFSPGGKQGINMLVEFLLAAGFLIQMPLGCAGHGESEAVPGLRGFPPNSGGRDCGRISVPD
jgi:hypothetical protein